ncbi:MAG: hypothetical protein V1819_01655 [bacterium]
MSKKLFVLFLFFFISSTTVQPLALKDFNRLPENKKAEAYSKLSFKDRAIAYEKWLGELKSKISYEGDLPLTPVSLVEKTEKKKTGVSEERVEASIIPIMPAPSSADSSESPLILYLVVLIFLLAMTISMGTWIRRRFWVGYHRR